MILKKPFVSISVTTFNQKNYIKDCLDGILNQRTTFQFEIILGEDQSNDGTREVCQDYAKRYPEKIKLFLRSRKDVIYINGNVTGRYNFLENLKACTGKYIALCDGDDYWTDPLKLQKQVDFLEANEDFSICGSLAKRIYENFQTQNDVEGEAGVFDQKDLAQRNFIPTASALIKREHIVNLPSWFTDCPIGDWPLFLLCANHGKIKMFNEQMVVRRIHQGGVWGANINSNNSIKNVMRLYDMFSILKDKFSDDVNSVLNKNYLKQSIKIVELSLKKEDFDKVDQYLHLLLHQGTDLTEETRQLTVAISNKLTIQEEEINQLKTLNSQLMNSTSYKLGRQITGLFKFLKT